MKFSLFLVLLLVAANTYADIVKVIGTNCQSKGIIGNGSGIIFSYNNEQYVLSSDHVTPSQLQNCFSLQTAKGAKSGLTLITSDWETGMSLLKVKNPIAGIDTALSDFDSNQSTLEVVSAGFPALSAKLLTDSARVAMSQSDRTPFVSSEHMIEFVGAQIEFGMSGGALLSATDNRIIGMISHQRLVVVPGRSTQFASGSKQTENHGLVIPSAEIVPWIKSSLASPASVYTRLSGNSVSGAGILFRESTRPVLLAAGKGGDGVGVGGSEDDSASISIEISIAAADQFNAQSGSRPEFDWVRQILPRLLKTGSISVSSVLVLNPENEGLEKRSISSTAQFLKLLRSGNCIPLVAGTNGLINAELNDLQSELLQITNNAELNNLKTLLRSLMDLKIQYGQVTIPKNYLANLQNHAGWKIFFEENFELAVRAKTFALSL